MPLRLLTFSTLYPNNARPNHGVFVENRLRHLVASGEASSEVVAPVPWFPLDHAWFGDWAINARVVASETRHGLNILHPRFPVIPRVGMSAAPALLYRAMVPVIGRLLREGHVFDAIDAHYVFPDGVAAVRLGHRFGLPVVVDAGDVICHANNIFHHSGPVLDDSSRATLYLYYAAGRKPAAGTAYTREAGEGFADLFIDTKAGAR